MRRFALSLLMLAVLLPAVAFARVAYLCHMDGLERAAPCCPNAGKTAKARQPAHPPATAITSTACCEVSQAAPITTLAADLPHATTELPPALVAIVATPPSAHPAQRVALPAPRAQAPPAPDSRSLFASRCAFLL